MGIASACLPLLAIVPVEAKSEDRPHLLGIAAFDARIVVSKPAARLLLKRLSEVGITPPAEGWFSVGEATAAVLKTGGCAVTVPPSGDDSEALLSCPALHAALSAARPRQPRVLIVRGVGGRELLAERLAEQGARVEYLELYTRQLPDYPLGTLRRCVQAERLNGLVVSSGQGFEHLRMLAGEDWPALAKLPLFVPSPRVAELARSAGAQQIVDCRGASATALVAAVQRSAAPAVQAPC